MNQEQQRWRRLLVGCALLIVAASRTPAHGSPALANDGTRWPARASALVSASSSAPGPGKFVHRAITRGNNTLNRVGRSLSRVGLTWLWIVVSIAVFFLTAAFSSVADIRMLDWRRRRTQSLSHYLGSGARTFFRLVRDRETPNLARSVLGVALLYWLVPRDLIPDESLLPGFIDDVIIAVSAAKGFIYLCPDALVSSHAAAVESRA